jgi:formylglycine-generating enzyme required for sulfatase activity
VSTDGSAWISGDYNFRIVRGGSWINDPRALRSAGRNGYPAVGRINGLGIRVGRTLNQ